MIDQGELDYKILVIAADDPLVVEHKVDDIADLAKLQPNTMGLLIDWLVNYKTTDGKPKNLLRSETPGGKQVIRHIAAEGLDRRPPAGACRLFLGPGFRLGACWNRLVETVKTRKKREKTGKKWARYGLKGVKDGS